MIEIQEKLKEVIKDYLKNKGDLLFDRADTELLFQLTVLAYEGGEK